MSLRRANNKYAEQLVVVSLFMQQQPALLPKQKVKII